MNLRRITSWLPVLTLLLMVTACGDDEQIAPVTINFSSTELAVLGVDQPTTVPIALSRNVDQNQTIIVQINSSNLTYGEEADYYTIPAATGDEISISVPSGSQDASFQVLQGAGLNIRQNEVLTFALVATAENLSVGSNGTMTMSFNENFIATSGTVELSAGGANFPEQAFFDFSKSAQSNVLKNSWDLGFSTAPGQFAVALNAPAYHMARGLETTDLMAVSSADTLGFAGEMVIPQFNPMVGAIDWVDTPDGNLATTAFGEIAGAEAEAQVFILRRATQDWLKVKVFRDGENYQLQWAAIDDTSFNEAEIAKDEAYNFIHFSFENAEVTVEPAKDAWDIMYSTYTSSLNLGGPGMNIPYGFNDMIIINRYQTSAAMVLTENTAFEDFSIDMVGDIIFEDDIDTVGSNWRAGGGPDSGPQLFNDRFFVIKDAEGLYYKLRFTRLTSVSGERGYPELTFERL